MSRFIFGFRKADSSEPSVLSYYTTNTPGNADVGGIYVWDESLGAWSNGTYYLKRTGQTFFWIYHKDTADMISAGTGTYMWHDMNATGDETPDEVTFVCNSSIVYPNYSGTEPAPIFAVVDGTGDSGGDSGDVPDDPDNTYPSVRTTNTPGTSDIAGTYVYNEELSINNRRIWVSDDGLYIIMKISMLDPISGGYSVNYYIGPKASIDNISAGYCMYNGYIRYNTVEEADNSNPSDATYSIGTMIAGTNPCPVFELVGSDQDSGDGGDSSDDGDNTTSYAFSISGITNPAEANGNYIEQSASVYKHETNEYYVSRDSAVSYWCLSTVANPSNPGVANFYDANGSYGITNPWEVTNWFANSSSTGTLVITEGGTSGS